MKLNDEILAALRRAINHYGNTSQFAKQIGVAHSTVLFWLSGKTTNISGQIWVTKLRKELQSFMEESDTPYRIGEDFVPFRGSPENRNICILNYSAMKDFDCTLQSPVSFIKARTEDTALFTNETKGSLFALLIDNPDISSFLPVGTKLLLSSSEYAQDGDLVVGKLRETFELFLCRYQYRNNRIKLIPLTPDASVMEWADTENAEKVFWLYPVQEISINLLNHRWEGNELVERE